jgi:LacI family transcriptional regulator
MLAEEAGVDRSTASRVLNDRLGKTSRTASVGTINRVLEAASRLGYKPNPVARSLRTSRTNQIGVLVPTLTDIVLATIYEGFEEAAMKHGFSTYVSNSLDDPIRRQQQTEKMLDRYPDALVFGDADSRDDFLIRQQERGLKFCLVSRRAPGCISATTDDFLGGQIAAQHLLELNMKDVVILSGQSYASTSVDRTAGFLEAFKSAGITINPKHVVNSPFDTAGGRATMLKLLETGIKPQAVFTTNDFSAIGAMSALQEFGLFAGENVGVIGFNDVPLAAAIPVPLTSIFVPHWEMGVKAFELTQAILNGEQPESIMLKPELRARKSTLNVGL